MRWEKGLSALGLRQEGSGERDPAACAGQASCDLCGQPDRLCSWGLGGHGAMLSAPEGLSFCGHEFSVCVGFPKYGDFVAELHLSLVLPPKGARPWAWGQIHYLGTPGAGKWPRGLVCPSLRGHGSACDSSSRVFGPI